VSEPRVLTRDEVQEYVTARATPYERAFAASHEELRARVEELERERDEWQAVAQVRKSDELAKLRDAEAREKTLREVAERLIRDWSDPRGRPPGTVQIMSLCASLLASAFASVPPEGPAEKPPTIASQLDDADFTVMAMDEEEL